MVADGSPFPFHVGQTAQYSRPINDAGVALFALITGDEHPLHLNHEYAAGTRFTRRIAPTMLVNGIIEAAFANTIPGIRGLFCHQNLDFLAPVYIEDEVTVNITITHIDETSGTMSCHIVTSRSDGVTAVSGDAEFTLEDFPPYDAQMDE